MYNLTYLGHRVTLPRLDLRSNFDLDLSRSNYTWFDAPWRDKHNGIKIVALPLKLKILSSKNRFGKFWNFDPWWPQFWPEPNNDRNNFEMIFRELSNAVFRFVLPCTGAEIDGGGCSNTPPPPAGGGKSRGPAGRGLRYVRVNQLILILGVTSNRIVYEAERTSWKLRGRCPHTWKVGWARAPTAPTATTPLGVKQRRERRNGDWRWTWLTGESHY